MAPTHIAPVWEGLTTFLVLGAFALFGWALTRRVLLLTAGKPERRTDRLGERLCGALARVLGQIRVARVGVGLAHVFIFWGFVVMAAANVVFIGEGIRAGFKLPYISEAGWYRWLFDVFAVLVALAVLFAAFRRAVLRPRGLTLSFGGYFILALIFGLMVTDVVNEGYLLATAGTRSAATPVGNVAADVLASAGLAGGRGFGLYAASWWLHLLLLLVFLVYIPMSKHLHLIFCPVNEFTRDLNPRGILKDCDVSNEDADHFGVIRADEFTWRQLLDFYACVECGRCQDNCPAFNTDKPLSPKKVVQDLKHDFLAYGTALVKMAKTPPVKEEGKGLAGCVVSDEELWACTTCGACMEHCPLAVEHVNKIVDLRRDLMMNEGRVPHELNAAMNGVERNNNPFGFPSRDRVKWAQGWDIPVLGQGAEAEYLLWVSCIGAYDDRGQRQLKALVKLLRAAGVSFATLGEEEGCCAESFRRLGHEYLYKMKLEENVNAFATYGVKRILTACPHCYNTFKNEYRALGYSYDVVHHTELLAQLIADGRLKVTAAAAGGPVTFHDSCYLGRYNGVYEAPRRLLRSTGASLVELPADKRRAYGFCCGAGGGRMWLEETVGKRINHARAEQCLATGAETVAVACAYCLTMLDDGVKDLGAGDRVAVRDVAEVLARTMEGDSSP